jgi:hypothetical protein
MMKTFALASLAALAPPVVANDNGLGLTPCVPTLLPEHALAYLGGDGLLFFGACPSRQHAPATSSHDANQRPACLSRDNRPRGWRSWNLYGESS